MKLWALAFLFVLEPVTWAQLAQYQRRVDAVRKVPGFVALWDFVLREDGAGGSGRFMAHQRKGDPADLSLDVSNYVLDYWGEGRAASYSDFPLRGRGPFGQSVRFARQSGNDFRPHFVVPRKRLHDSGIDVKGPNRSVSLVAWVAREAGNHVIAGIWHEGTDLQNVAEEVKRVERGQRQYALFSGLAANPGASAAHVSENGAASFGDRFARNLSVTPETIPLFTSDSEIDNVWAAVGFVFDNARDTVTSYLNGVATDHWIDEPQKHPFFQWPAKAWLQAQLHRQPGLQEGEDPDFPRDQFYTPPEDKPLARSILSETAEQRVEVHTFKFTKVRVTLGRDARGRFHRVLKRDLAALRVNPFWFPHDLYAPQTPEEGGPFTIGEVIHSSRSQGFIGYFGGLAVFNRAITPREMKTLAELARQPITIEGIARSSR